MSSSHRAAARSAAIFPMIVGDVGPWIYAVGLAGPDDGVDRRGALAVRLRTSES
jgi:hypothetical protein